MCIWNEHQFRQSQGRKKGRKAGRQVGKVGRESGHFVEHYVADTYMTLRIGVALEGWRVKHGGPNGWCEVRLRMGRILWQAFVLVTLDIPVAHCKWLSSRLSRFYKVEVPVSQSQDDRYVQYCASCSTDAFCIDPICHWHSSQEWNWSFVTLIMLLLTIPAPSEFVFHKHMRGCVCERRLQSLYQCSVFLWWTVKVEVQNVAAAWPKLANNQLHNRH